MDTATQRKWDSASRSFDFISFGDDHRMGPHKRRLFSKMRGATLMLAAGTGNDFRFFPPKQSFVAIDISPKMLEQAAVKAAAYDGTIDLRELDVCQLPFPDNSFDTVVTVCTFCSVPKPVGGLRELYRILKPGGQILMFEHVRSRIGLIGVFLDLMTPLSSRIGPDLNRDTVGNVQKAGFRIRREENVYLDIVKIIEGVKEPV
ncbi:class I SAM-dependent methyltransferase [Candidatus Binatus sp.]|uniref:class I SAM-dependent methyltransferase n=1 Tax=Candidatus Binatus sp. TaxID=2811406 RepID=UPI002F94FF12